MSATRHETEINHAAREKKTRDILDAIRAQACPFCGRREWFIIGPLYDDVWGWIVGCESLRCDSTWKITRDHLFQILAMLEKRSPNLF